MPSTEDQMLRIAKRVNPENPAEALESLRGETQLLDRLFASAEILPLPAVPAALSDSLVGIMRSERGFEAIPHVIPAVLIHDSRDSRELVGVRGIATPDLTAWTAMFSTPEADLIVDGAAADNGITMISGHVLSRSGEHGSFRIVNMTGSHDVLSDEIGKFELGGFEPGEYEFEASAEGLRFSWALAL